jgi:hypothetical protein
LLQPLKMWNNRFVCIWYLSRCVMNSEGRMFRLWCDVWISPSTSQSLRPFYFLYLWCVFLTIVSNLLVQASKFSLSHLLIVLDLDNFCFQTSPQFVTLHNVEWFHTCMLHVRLKGVNKNTHFYLSQTCHYDTTLI